MKNLILLLLIAAGGAGEKIDPPMTLITPEHPLILLQVSAAFGDTDDAPEQADRFAEADRHGSEIVRLWNLLPEDVRPYCHLQVELRVRDHDLRLNLFRRMLAEPQRMGVPVSVQIADPHDEYVFDPAHVEILMQEFSCVKSLMLSEQRFAHYDDFNVESYAIPPQTRYTCDIIKLAAQYGRHAVIVLQGLKWLHVGADRLNLPLLEVMQAYPDHVIPINEYIEPRHLIRQTATWGMWLGGYSSQWGVEPQSWWYESSFMNGPGRFGDHLHPVEMPPQMYRPMILQGAAMGATVYSFEPWWDLFDYDNSRCWTEVILPTLREILSRKLIPTKAQVQEKTRVAYQLTPAADIREFHKNMKDLDWLSDDGYLAMAAYGVWQPMMQFELIPNRGDWFLPILPAPTPESVLHRYDSVLRSGQAQSMEEWKAVLAPFWPEERNGPHAWSCSINHHVYVMQTHENLYERQVYSVEVARPIREITASQAESGTLRIEWPADPGASQYYVWYSPGTLDSGKMETRILLGDTVHPFYELKDPSPGHYTVGAETVTKEIKSGTVNYLDCLVFGETISDPKEEVFLSSSGKVEVNALSEGTDSRPVSQTVYPTYDGVSDENMPIAEELVRSLDLLKEYYERMDWRGMTSMYSDKYVDPNGFHKEYVGRAWKWWFRRNNKTFMIRQIRNWDFGEYSDKGSVRIKMLLFCTAVRWDDQPFGYDGMVRIPRHKGAEVLCTWIKEGTDWRLLHTDPALPNLEEILWNSRPMDKEEKLIPGVDE